MAAPNPLPPEVAAALQRGNIVEAVKLLRKTVNLTLKEAKAAIDERSRAASAPPLPTRPPHVPMNSPLQLPLEALQALRLGKEIEAINIVREKARIGLKEAKDAVDAYRRANPGIRPGLSPGEVPPVRNEFWVIASIAILAFGIWLFFL